MNIKASSINLIDFFTKDEPDYSSEKLLVPAFQRNYAWDAKHVKDLLGSIADSNSGSGYYIGNILIQNSKGSRASDLIIDGQQRLTTLFLTLRALKEYGLNKKNFVNYKKIIFSSDSCLRIKFTRENLDKVFKDIFLNDEVSDDVFLDTNSKKIIKNLEFIKKQLKEIDNKNDYFNKVINLVFVVIRFDEGFDVNQLFEGLNSKGKILSTVQLTKNALFGSCKDDAHNERIIKAWEDIESSFEKNNGIWFDKFLRHFGFYNYGYVSNKALFVKLKKDLKNNENQLWEFSKNLKDDADLYLKIRKGELVKSDISKNLAAKEWSVIERIILHLSQADLEQVHGVTFSCIKRAKNHLNYISTHGKSSYFFEDLRKLWAFSLLAKYLDLKPSSFETKYANFSHNLSQDDIGSKRLEFFKYLSSIIGDQNIKKFSKNLNSRIKITGESSSNVNSRNNRNYVSQLLYFYMEKGKKFTLEDLVIEHIIPKGKNNGLVKWVNISQENLKQVEKISRYKFGNLTLLAKDISGVENFDTKMKAYLKDGNKKNNRQLKKYSIFFNSENPSVAVEKRGEDMAKQIFKYLNEILQ